MTLKKPLFAGIFFVSVFAAYMTTFTGHIRSGDNICQYLQTTQILDKGKLSFTADDIKKIEANDPWHIRNRFLPNRDGKEYSQMYGIGQAIMAAPLFVVLRAAKVMAGASVPQDVTLWCVNWLFYSTACVGAVFYFARSSGVAASRVWVAALPLSAAYASPLWMNSDLAFNTIGEVLVIFLLIAVCLALYFSHARNEIVVYSLSAAAALLPALGYLVRPFFAASVPAFVFLYFISLRRLRVEASVKKTAIAVFGVGLLAAGVSLALYNGSYFGSPASTAYGDRVHFTSPWLDGFTGTFLAPLCSPLYFFPVIVLLLPALAYLAFKRDPMVVFLALFLAPQIALIPSYPFWDSAPDLFSRYWLRVVPVAYLAIAFSVSHVGSRAWKLALVAVFIGLSLFGVRAQYLTSMTDERTIYAEVSERIRKDEGVVEVRDYRESFLNLFWNDKVSAAQSRALSDERRFLILRSVAVPAHRAGFVWAALFVSFASLIGYARDRRA